MEGLKTLTACDQMRFGFLNKNYEHGLIFSYQTSLIHHRTERQEHNFEMHNIMFSLQSIFNSNRTYVVGMK